MGGGKWVLTVLAAACTGSAITYALMDMQERKRRRDEREYQQFFGSGRAASATDAEGLISGILRAMWSDCWNPGGCALMKDIVGPMLTDMFPTGALSGMEIVKLDLGQTPLALDNIAVHQVEERDGSKSCQFDMDVLWDGHCDISIRAPKLSTSFGVKSIKLFGRMTIVFKPLTQVIPCISGISYAFINSPHLSIDLTGLASIGEFSAIDGTVKSTIKSVLDGMLVLPNRMAYKMDPTCNILQMYSPPIGVVRIVILSSRGFQVEQRVIGNPDVPDVYCKVSVGNAREVKTRVIKDNLSPSWENEPMDFLLHDYDQFLNLHAWDEDTGALDADDDLGKIAGNVRVRDLLLAPNCTMELELFNSDDATKSMGAFVTVQAYILPLSPMEKVDESLPTTSSADDSVVTKHLIPGMLTVMAARAYGIPEGAQKDGTFVKMQISTGETFDSAIVQALPDGSIDAKDPVFDMFKDIPLSPLAVAAKPAVTLTLYKYGAGGDVKKNVALGSTKVEWDELQTRPAVQDKRDIGDGILLEFNVTLRGVQASYEPDELQTEPASTPEPVAAPESAPAAMAAPSATIGEVKTKPASAVADRGTTQAPRTAPVIKQTKTSVPSVHSKMPFSTKSSAASSTRSVRVEAVRGRGFVVRHKGPLRKKDIPDVYLKIMIPGESKPWKTPVVKNSITPEWNAGRTFQLTDADTITVEGWDKNSGPFDKDDLYGVASVTVGKILLSGGTVDLELKSKKTGNHTGLFITMGCSLE